MSYLFNVFLSFIIGKFTIKVKKKINTIFYTVHVYNCGDTITLASTVFLYYKYRRSPRS